MEYLSRTSSPITNELWTKIDEKVVEIAKQQLIARRFINLHGPLGSKIMCVNVDSSDKKEVFKDGFVFTEGRKIQKLTHIYQDFSLLWQDLESGLDLSQVSYAASRMASLEDDLIFFGNQQLNIEGLFTIKEAHKIKKGDWFTGEEAYQDVAKAVGYLRSNNMIGRYYLVLSPELYLQLQRLQPSVGLLEIDRIAKLVDGIYSVGEYGKGKAALICSQPQFIDLSIGIDMVSAYLEQKELNHYFRIMETLALRIKEPKAIVHFQ